jgi:hypothetical protein
MAVAIGVKSSIAVMPGSCLYLYNGTVMYVGPIDKAPPLGDTVKLEGEVTCIFHPTDYATLEKLPNATHDMFKTPPKAQQN